MASPTGLSAGRLADEGGAGSGRVEREPPRGIHRPAANELTCRPPHPREAAGHHGHTQPLPHGHREPEVLDDDAPQGEPDEGRTAATLGLSVNTVKTHLHRGIEALGTTLEAQR